MGPTAVSIIISTLFLMFIVVAIGAWLCYLIITWGRPKKAKPAKPQKVARVKEPKPVKPAPQPKPLPAPDYMRRWTFDRRWREQQALLRFDQFLNESAAPAPTPTPAPAPPRTAPAESDVFRDLREKLAQL